MVCSILHHLLILSFLCNTPGTMDTCLPSLHQNYLHHIFSFPVSNLRPRREEQCTYRYFPGALQSVIALHVGEICNAATLIIFSAIRHNAEECNINLGGCTEFCVSAIDHSPEMRDISLIFQRLNSVLLVSCSICNARNLKFCSPHIL